MERTVKAKPNAAPAPKKGVILIDLVGLSWYQDGATNSVSIPFPPGSVKSFEILKHQEIASAIATAIQTQKIAPSHVILAVTTRAFFVQDIAKDADITKNQEALDNYLSMVPFEEVVYTTIPSAKSTKVLACNHELIEVVQDALVDQKFTVEFAFPTALLGEQYTNLTALDARLGSLILSKSEVLKKNALTPVKKVVDDEIFAPVTQETQTKPNPHRQYILLAIFGVLLVVLGVVVYMNILAPQEAPPTKNTAALPTAPPAAPTTALSPTPEIIPDVASISAQIVYTDSQANAQKLQSALEDKGIKNVTVRSGTQLTIPRTKISFGPDVSTATKDAIVAMVKTQYPQASTEESTNTTVDVVITTQSAE